MNRVVAQFTREAEWSVSKERSISHACERGSWGARTSSRRGRVWSECGPMPRVPVMQGTAGGRQIGACA